jgi:hypothetical protein
MGSPVIGYVVEIMYADSQSSSEELTYCDGSQQDVIDATSCSIPIGQLRSPPFSLPWGSSISVRVQAANQYGLSVHSVEGNGAIILTYPDAPLNLSEDPTYKSGTQIGLTWEEGVENGGTAVLDYRLSYDQGTGEYVYLYTGIAFTSWIITDLTPGA